MKQLPEYTVDVCGIPVNAISKGTNFHIRISKAEAERLLTEYNNLPFEIFCKEYDEANNDGDEWTGVTYDDISDPEDPHFADWHKTFEIMMDGFTMLDLPSYYFASKGDPF